MSTITKRCKIHGETDHRLRSKSDNYRYRCLKCVVDAVTKRRRKLKEMSIAYKGGECNNCGYDRSIAALEFHHRDPAEKDFAIGGAGTTRSFEAIKVELDKCDLLCANCHREEHARLDGSFIGTDDFMIAQHYFDEINT